MIRANSQCKFHTIALWFLLVEHAYLTMRCEPPWTQSNCTSVWMKHDGQPQDLMSATEITTNCVLKSVKETQRTYGSPGFGCVNNGSCWEYGWDLLSYTGSWTSDGETMVYACCGE
nr:unnamed protein product [Fasciola hepatica]